MEFLMVSDYMNIEVLEKIIKSKSNYFIGNLESIVKINYNDVPNIFLFAVPSKILKIRPSGELNKDNEFVINDSQISLATLKEINECYIDTNIPLSNNHTPFQLGIMVSRFADVYELNDSKINEFLLKVLTLRNNTKNQYLDYSLLDYKKLYNELNQTK